MLIKNFFNIIIKTIAIIATFLLLLSVFVVSLIPSLISCYAILVTVISGIITSAIMPKIKKHEMGEDTIRDNQTKKGMKKITAIADE